MKIAGTVVLYNPDESVIQNLQTYLPLVEKLYVIDNSTKEITFLEKILDLGKIEYISLNGNQGIAKALKVATEKAVDEGYDFILTMDQDSKYPTEDFPIIKNYLTQKDDNVAVVAINHTGNVIELSENKDKAWVQECDHGISSGMMIDLKAYPNIAGFNSDLFIDLVDHDLCYQFWVKGYKVVIFPNIILEHSLGKVQEWKFLWLKRRRHVHAPIRYYYMYRNYTYLKKYSSKAYQKLLAKYRERYELAGIIRRIIFQKEHFQIFRMIRKGIRDGKRGILGPYREGK